MNWQELFVALALVLVIEGLIPFLNPSAYRKFIESIKGASNGALRVGGFTLMITGLVVLYFVR